MTERLVLVDRRADAPPPAAGSRIVVLDAAWTPPPGERPDIAPIRPTLEAVLDEVDVIDGSLALLDAWAADARLADRMVADGVSWWFQVRMLLRWEAHELVLWRHVLRRLVRDGDAAVHVPGGRANLAAVARAMGGRGGLGGSGSGGRRPGGRHVVLTGAGVAAGSGLPGAARRLSRRVARAVGRRPALARVARLAMLGARGVRHGIGLLPGLTPPASEGAARARALDARLAAMRTRPGGVLAITWPRAYQLVRDAAGGERRIDPHLGPPLDRLAAEGVPVASVGLGLDHRRDADWALLQADETLLPESLLTSRLLRPRDILLDSARVAAAVAGARSVPALVDEVDLGPALADLVEPYTGAWLDWQRLRLRWAERAIAAIRPGVLFTDREGSRASWLAAADRAHVPTVAVQHGMIYPGNPEYVQPAHPASTRPTWTCVFGPSERDLLVAAGYDADGVVVTGSPRWNALLGTEGGAVDPLPAARDRQRIRAELGTRDGERLLVVSVAHNEILGELHTFTALARLLGGSLPGVHVVIKLHPQDEAPPRHVALVEGLARAGGYEPPRVTTVRDIDLHALLRAADAHLGQYSTVLSDAVVTGTPNMIAVGQGYADALGYVAAGVAVPVRTVDDVRAFMADPQPPAPEARSGFLAAHYRDGDAVGRTADVLRAVNAGRRA